VRQFILAKEDRGVSNDWCIDKLKVQLLTSAVREVKGISGGGF